MAGYLFEFTPFDKNSKFPVRIYHGLTDTIRPWDEVRPSYERQGAHVEMIPGMEHKIDSKELRQKIRDFILSIY